MSDVEQYAEYFMSGLKITVCIPMENNELFRDWAIVEALDEDIITLRLSRDELPVEVHLIAGAMLDLRLGKDGMGFRCGGFFVEEVGAGEIKVHLTGEVGTNELREFFRIDAFIPFRYQFTKEQNLDVLIGTWRKSKKNRLAAEAERRDAFIEKQREMLFRAAAGEFDAEGREQVTNRPPDVEEFNPVDESWDDVNASAINISGGGFKFVTTDDFKIDELVVIEMFIPAAPPRIMDGIARVVFKNNNYSIKDGSEYFNVALSFVVIDDRDRDAIVSHISHLETMRIRQKGQLPFIDFRNTEKRRSLVKTAIWIAFGVIFIYFASSYLFGYSQRAHNEFEDMVGNAVRKYREQTGQKW